ncbi:MAG TPA: MarR family transcriptional regulator [Mycobacteriales bacterium]|nr:MarR family transcriptional regulator [Mycobacteriales bacterium]
MTRLPHGAEAQPTAADAREVWALMGELVLDNVRRREVAEALGLSFGRVRAIRRIARQPMSMGELAAAMSIDPPNATTLVDDLERLGLAERRPHPSDRRAKVVTATRDGIAVARRADEILSTPPPALSELAMGDLLELRRILHKLRGS